MSDTVEFKGKHYKLELCDGNYNITSGGNCCLRGTLGCGEITAIKDCLINGNSAEVIECEAPVKTELTIEDIKELYEGRVIYLVNAITEEIRYFIIAYLQWDKNMGDFFLYERYKLGDPVSVTDYKILGLHQTYNNNASFFSLKEAKNYLKTLRE